MKAVTLPFVLALGLASFVAPAVATEEPPYGAPLLVLPAPDQAEVALAAAQTRPWRFAVDVPVAVSPWVDGVWLENGLERVWQLRLHSAGAESMALHFDRWQLPPGAELWLKDVDSDQVQGPYDEAQNFRGALWTGMILGDEVLVELHLPVGAAEPDIHIDKAFHGFRGAQGSSLQKSGDCNIDVACPEANNFRDQVQATVLLVIEGTGACSGTLINNTSNDRRPLVLTANHCGIRSNNVQSVVSYFNFERSNCLRVAQSSRQDVQPDPQQSLPGATFLARSVHSDFTLIELDGQGATGSIPSTFNPYWAGWTRDETPAQSGVSIHHPSGDAKSVTPFAEALQAFAVQDGGNTVQTWRVFWAPPSGGRNGGTTEPGSSGSGIFGSDGLLRGQLYGGEASCANQRAPDFYGRFAVSWDGGVSVRECLRPWLDPQGVSPTSLMGVSRSGENGLLTGAGAPSNADRCQGDVNAPEGDGGGSGSGAADWWLLAGVLLMRKRRSASL